MSEYGIEESLKLSTSSRLMGCDEEPDKQVPVGVNSNYVFPGFDSNLLIYVAEPLDLDVWNP